MSSFHSLVVTNRSPRGTPERRIPSPTDVSLRYIIAVSICLYPFSNAACTAFTVVSPSGVRNTPRPICGMTVPLFSVIVD